MKFHYFKACLTGKPNADGNYPYNLFRYPVDTGTPIEALTERPLTLNNNWASLRWSLRADKGVAVFTRDEAQAIVERYNAEQPAFVR